jgi:hypothetical protein
MAVTLSNLHAGRPLPIRKIPGTHFCQRLTGFQGRIAAGRIRSIEKIDFIETQTRDLPVCSVVPQPTTIPRAPDESTSQPIYLILSSDIRISLPNFRLSTFHLVHPCYMPRPSHPHMFGHRNNILWRAQIEKLLIKIVNYPFAGAAGANFLRNIINTCTHRHCAKRWITKAITNSVFVSFE